MINISDLCLSVLYQDLQQFWIRPGLSPSLELMTVLAFDYLQQPMWSFWSPIVPAYLTAITTIWTMWALARSAWPPLREGNHQVKDLVFGCNREAQSQARTAIGTSRQLVLDFLVSDLQLIGSIY